MSVIRAEPDKTGSTLIAELNFEGPGEVSNRDGEVGMKANRPTASGLGQQRGAAPRRADDARRRDLLGVS